jgi:hypothetical protein
MIVEGNSQNTFLSPFATSIFLKNNKIKKLHGAT